jgi:hypothetical protein
MLGDPLLRQIAEAALAAGGATVGLERQGGQETATEFSAQIKVSRPVLKDPLGLGGEPADEFFHVPTVLALPGSLDQTVETIDKGPMTPVDLGVAGLVAALPTQWTHGETPINDNGPDLDRIFRNGIPTRHGKRPSNELSSRGSTHRPKPNADGPRLLAPRRAEVALRPAVVETKTRGVPGARRIGMSNQKDISAGLHADGEVGLGVIRVRGPGSKDDRY